jgi:hypothetical protein
LRNKFGYTKRELAKHFEVGATTIWENIFRKYRPMRIVIQRVCIPCEKCEICLTKEVNGSFIPLNYQVGKLCVVCYLRSIGLTFRETFKEIVEID